VKHSLKPLASLILTSIVLAALCGCASMKETRGDPGQRLDPFESWNRKVFAFNEGLDAHFLKPVATGYTKVVPQFVRRGVDNFFNNAADAWSSVNALLQGKVDYSMQDLMRVATNSAFGVLGLVDVATELGIERHNEDFGLTLGRWGFGAGAYIVWPLFGPSTVRDSIALPLDRAASPALLISDGRWQFGITVLQVVNIRANLLGASQVIDDIALDKYTFLRDAYLQRRRSLVSDGEVTPDSDLYAPQQPDSAASGTSGGAALPKAPSGAASSVAPPAPAASDADAGAAPK
jgi:phospholipid-binding lipoprotein MlaA